MKIFKDKIKHISSSSLILGFFDGIHLGHKKVINSAISFSKKNNTKTLLITFKKSPAEYFNKENLYIYSREDNYKLITDLGVDYILELDFTEYVKLSADDFFHFLIKNFNPKSISTGFNYTFGANRSGNSKYLGNNQYKYNYKYLCSNKYEQDNLTICTTLIKKLLSEGNINKANELLDNNFKIKSTVIKGNQLGRKIGFPTANLKYPENIIKIPHGVYKSIVLNKPAILNWGVKPTINGKNEILEVHIPNFKDNLYNKTLEIEILDKIRDEKKFENLNELKLQIEKDIKCLEL